MTTSQKLAVSLSETRQKINELGAHETPTTEQRSELAALQQTYSKLETEWRAAIQAESEITVEPDPALRGLESRASLGGIVDSVFRGSEPAGAEAELQKELNLAGNQVPLALLREPGLVEVRTVGGTPAPADVGQNQQPIIPAVFPQAAAAFLGIAQPSVAVGEAVYTVLSTSATPGTPAEDDDQATSIGAFEASVLSPARIQASMFYSREDRARLMGMGEALRMNLSDALADKLDDEVLTGTDGLLTGTNLANNNVNAVTAFAGYLDNFGYGRVDGTWATMASDLRIVMGAGTYAHAGAVYRNNSVDRNALERLQEVTGGVRVSSHVPAVANQKQNAVIRRGMRMDAVAPIWEGVTIIEDEVTQAKAGEIVLTAIMLFKFAILRAAGFSKQQSQHA